MDLSPEVETGEIKDTLKLPDQPNFEQKARALINRTELAGGILHPDQVIARANEFIRQYNVPEALIDDETNLALILGCSQKLTDSSDPLYKSRVENLARRLISPEVEREVLDKEELWGSDPDTGGLNEENLKKYVASKTDPIATEQFIAKHKEQLDLCREVWRQHGYNDLEIQVHIVDDDLEQFQANARSTAYISIPEKNQLNDPNYKPVVEVVLLKGHTAERDDFVKHELYHIQDFFGLVRRGFQSGIFELLGELHTERAVGNYDATHSQTSSNIDSYVSAKHFWDTLSFVADLDFNMLGDRQLVIDTVIQKFGFEGLVDFALVYAHSSGKANVFETFYSRPERGVFAMLIDRDKLSLLKSLRSGTVDIDAARVQSDIAALVDYMRQFQNSGSLYSLLPTQFGNSSPDKQVKDNGSHPIDNAKVKQFVNSFTKALAVADLYAQGVPIVPPATYDALKSSLEAVFSQRQDEEPAIDELLDKKWEQFRTYYDSKEAFIAPSMKPLFKQLVSKVPHIEIAFNLSNPDIRQSILSKFYTQLDPLIEYAQQSDTVIKSFIQGMYGNYNLPFELRESSADYISANYPRLQPLVEKARQLFDSRKITFRV